MIITKEIDYSLRILRTLSDYNKKTVSKISEETCVPEAFTYKITKKLAKQDWIKIYRGIEGGCELITPLNKITLLEVIKIIGDNKSFTPCINTDYACNWKACNNGWCNIHNNLVIIQKNLENELNRNTLDVIFFDKKI